MKMIEYKKQFTRTVFQNGEMVEEQYTRTVAIPYSADAEEKAKTDSVDGDCVIYDDGQPEPPPTTEQRVSDLEEQLAQSDETAIALYEAQEAQEVINAQQDEALMELYEMKY